MKQAISAFLLMTLTACTANAPQDTQKVDASTTVKTVTVGPQTVDCVGVGPMKCLIVDDAFFYDRIQGFDFEPGYEYQLKIEQRQRFSPSNVPADASLYEYRLVDVLSKIKPE
ncbi:hypothetical protein GCM10011502_28600 [Oceanisphaera marina]|uniref:DUF4377 domain-containing protein n=1 Tax=Oceanisphaera marina TaxID=2017550 RepID=A0ABQ1IWK6_9GAMM|nr:DUF4377 domain-containing protein [Oceanisphaera marina]GGB53665.1 hypothetical protein GCM10011502_28600 [Oceanisphaera marina]